MAKPTLTPQQPPSLEQSSLQQSSQQQSSLQPSTHNRPRAPSALLSGPAPEPAPQQSPIGQRAVLPWIAAFLKPY
ncbi:MAG: hypothetical protein ACRDBI_13725, partial [Shewanella sp.]